ncbi:MAG TPA: DoxX family protein [Dysgonomonas sp.]|nr:DoxX family protein [Dysgonomonas sp.]
MNKEVNIGLLILRIGVGGLMLLHGIYKLFNGIGAIEQQIIDMGMPAFFAYGVYIGEVLAPILIIIGLAARPAALVLATNCIVAMLMVHSADIFSLNAQGGWSVELLGLYLFGSITLIFTGAGRYAVSHKYWWD